jgi:hypothetical protein
MSAISPIAAHVVQTPSLVQTQQGQQAKAAGAAAVNDPDHDGDRDSGGVDTDHKVDVRV